MMDRIFYTIAAASAVAAAILFSIVAYQYLKDHAASVDNVYPLHRRIL